MADYLLGLATLPALVAVGWLAVRVRRGVESWLAWRGWFVEWSRPPGDKGRWMDYTLRHDVCWERQAGPFVVGHWYRDNVLEHAATRWWGIGSARGHSLLVLHKRTFGAR